MKTFEQWREYFKIHSQTRLHKTRLTKAKEVIGQFLDLYPNSYVSWSGGKDSTALLHLVISIKPDVKIMTEKDDMDYPNEITYIKSMIDKYNLNCDIISPDTLICEDLSKYSIDEDLHSRNTDFSERYFYKLLRKYKNENNFDGVFLGLRAEESKNRTENRKKKGHIYYNQRDKDFVCQPIVDWKGEDVFAYLVSNNIPILDIYTKLQFINDPRLIRKGWYLPSNNASKGFCAWLKFYYPELFQKLIQIVPILKSYI